MENLSQLESQAQEAKENWSKPELKVIDVKINTLGTFAGVGADSGIYS